MCCIQLIGVFVSIHNFFFLLPMTFFFGWLQICLFDGFVVGILEGFFVDAKVFYVNWTQKLFNSKSFFWKRFIETFFCFQYDFFLQTICMCILFPFSCMQYDNGISFAIIIKLNKTNVNVECKQAKESPIGWDWFKHTYTECVT